VSYQKKKEQQLFNSQIKTAGLHGEIPSTSSDLRQKLNLKIATCRAQRAGFKISWLICLFLPASWKRAQALLQSLLCPNTQIRRHPFYL